jgi:hypothetical protein
VSWSSLPAGVAGGLNPIGAGASVAACSAAGPPAPDIPRSCLARTVVCASCHPASSCSGGWRLLFGTATLQSPYSFHITIPSGRASTKLSNESPLYKRPSGYATPPGPTRGGMPPLGSLSACSLASCQGARSARRLPSPIPSATGRGGTRSLAAGLLSLFYISCRIATGASEPSSPQPGAPSSRGYMHNHSLVSRAAPPSQRRSPAPCGRRTARQRHRRQPVPTQAAARSVAGRGWAGSLDGAAPKMGRALSA